MRRTDPQRRPADVTRRRRRGRDASGRKIEQQPCSSSSRSGSSSSSSRRSSSSSSCSRSSSSSLCLSLHPLPPRSALANTCPRRARDLTTAPRKRLTRRRGRDLAHSGALRCPSCPRCPQLHALPACTHARAQTRGAHAFKRNRHHLERRGRRGTGDEFMHRAGGKTVGLARPRHANNPQHAERPCPFMGRV